MIATIDEQVTGRRRPDGTPNVRTITRTLIEGTVTEVLTLTGSWKQPHPSQDNDLMTVYIIDAGDGTTVRVADTETADGRRTERAIRDGREPRLVTAGATVRIVADPRTSQAGDYTTRTLDVL